MCTAKGQIVSEGSRSLKTPPLNVVFKGRQPGQQQGVLDAKEGYIQDLSTLTRNKDMSLYENGKEVVIYGSVNLREFKVICIIFLNYNSSEGSIRVRFS